MSFAACAGATGDIFLGHAAASAPQRLTSPRNSGFGATLPDGHESMAMVFGNPEPWLPALRLKLASVKALPAGWDGPNSVAVDPRLIALVERVLRDSLVGIANPRLPFVVPTSDGCVQIEWHRRGMDVEVFFGRDGEVSAFVEDQGAGAEVEKTGAEALNLLFRWAPRAAAEDRDGIHVQIQEANRQFELAA